MDRPRNLGAQHIVDFVTPDAIVPHAEIMAALEAIGITADQFRTARVPIGALLTKVVDLQKPGAYRIEANALPGQICIYFYNSMERKITDWSVRVVINDTGIASAREASANRLQG